MNSSTDSAITYLVPSTSVTTVSGVLSARSTRAGFRANSGPLRRVTRITAKSVLVCGRHPCDRRRARPTEEKPGAGGPARPRGSGVVLEGDQVLEDLVGGGDHAGVGLEATLGDDQVGELLGEVHVRHLQPTLLQVSPAARAG